MKARVDELMGAEGWSEKNFNTENLENAVLEFHSSKKDLRTTKRSTRAKSAAGC